MPSSTENAGPNRLLSRTGVLICVVVTLALVLAAGWIARRFCIVSREERAIRHLPGVVLFSHERWEFGGPEGPVEESTPPGPAWLRRVLGDRMFYVPDDLFLERYDIKDDDLAVLGDLPSLRKVDLSGTPITDAALAYLDPLEHLEELKLGGTKISSRAIADLDRFADLKALVLPEFESGVYHVEDLEVLSRLGKLEELVMHFNPLGEKGLSYVAGLTRLRRLGINGYAGPAGSFRHLAALENLEWLVASTSETSDEDVAHLSRCQNLRVLSLYGGNFTPSGCAAIARLKNLEDVTLFKLHIDERNVESFLKLPKLKTLYAETISDGGRRRLEAAHPGAYIGAYLEEGQAEEDLWTFGK